MKVTVLGCGGSWGVPAIGPDWGRCEPTDPRNRRRRWVRAVMWPGLQLQKLTTREPDLEQLAVAIAAMQAVLAVEDPRNASAEDTVGMEVVA